MEKKSGGSFVVKQWATQSLCVWYSSSLSSLEKRDKSDVREKKTETVKGGGTSSYRMKRKKREREGERERIRAQP